MASSVRGQKVRCDQQPPSDARPQRMRRRPVMHAPSDSRLRSSERSKAANANEQEACDLQHAHPLIQRHPQGPEMLLPTNTQPESAWQPASGLRRRRPHSPG